MCTVLHLICLEISILFSIWLRIAPAGRQTISSPFNTLSLHARCKENNKSGPPLRAEWYQCITRCIYSIGSFPSDFSPSAPPLCLSTGSSFLSVFVREKDSSAQTSFRIFNLRSPASVYGAVRSRAELVACVFVEKLFNWTTDCIHVAFNVEYT